MITQANGFAKGLMRRVVVSFDDETFAQVRAYAVSGKCSFGEAVRQLVETGLEEHGADARKEMAGG